MKTVLIENVIYGVLALAFLIPLTTGTYDLSIGSMMSMSLVINNYMAKETSTPQVFGMVLGLVACAIAGFIAGFFVVKLRVNSFIATLAMSQVITAFILHTSEQTISGAFKRSYQQIGAKEVFGLPLFFYYLVILALICWYVFEHTPVGRYMFATGGNPDGGAPRRRSHRPTHVGLAGRVGCDRRVRRHRVFVEGRDLLAINRAGSVDPGDRRGVLRRLAVEGTPQRVGHGHRSLCLRGASRASSCVLQQHQLDQAAVQRGIVARRSDPGQPGGRHQGAQAQEPVRTRAGRVSCRSPCCLTHIADVGPG